MANGPTRAEAHGGCWQERGLNASATSLMLGLRFCPTSRNPLLSSWGPPGRPALLTSPLQGPFYGGVSPGSVPAAPREAVAAAGQRSSCGTSQGDCLPLRGLQVTGPGRAPPLPPAALTPPTSRRGSHGGEPGSSGAKPSPERDREPRGGLRGP